MGLSLRITTLAAISFAATAADAQLPTATGRQIALSQPQWRLFIPDDYAHRPGDEVDLLVHFHGNPQTVWNNAAYADLNAVIVTVNYSGLSSAYSGPFSDTSLFQTVLDDAQTTLAAQADFDSALTWDRLAVSSFSAGYGAVREILTDRRYLRDIDAILAADSLYASTASDGTALDSQMVNYKRYANLAKGGATRFVFTHSQVETFTYESTAETGDELLDYLNLTAEPTGETGLGPLRYYRKAASGNFALWGARGAAGDDHLNHLRYIGEWLGDLGLAQHGPEGDFNGDGAVDAADYAVWREEYPGHKMRQDYDRWRDNVGAPTPPNAVAVPEPATITGAAATIALGLGCRRPTRLRRACGLVRRGPCASRVVSTRGR